MLKVKSNQEIKYVKKKKKPKQNKIVSGIELYGHTYMLIIGQVHLFRLQSIKKIYAQSQPIVVGFENYKN